MTHQRALVAACLAACSLLGQNVPPPGAKLEDLREWSRAKVAAQEGQLKETLDKVARLFNATPYGSDSAAVREAVQSLAERAAVFADKILDRIAETKNDDVRRHFGDVLVAAGDPALATQCLARAKAAPPDLAAVLVAAAAKMRSPAAADSFRALAAQSGAPEPVRAAAIVGLARSGAADGRDVARQSLSDSSAAVRRAGAEALGFVGAGREDCDALRKGVADQDADVGRAALRALGRFKGDLDGLKTLHEALGGTDLPTIQAALDGVEAAGSKDLSMRPLLDAVRKAPVEVRPRAAKVLMSLGSPEGIKTLYAKEKKDADQNVEDRDAQISVGDRFREFGWYEGALTYYERALTAKGGSVVAQQTLVALARCNARLRRFDEARRRLKLAGYTSLKAFAEDPDFSEMREAPGHKDAFK